MSNLVEKMAEAMLSAGSVRPSVRQHLGRDVALKFARACLSAIEAEGFRIMSEGDIKKVRDEGVQEGLLDH